MAGSFPQVCRDRMGRRRGAQCRSRLTLARALPARVASRAMASVGAPRDTGQLEQGFEEHRRELTAYCYRMLASPYDAGDAAQQTMLRAWRSYSGFEGRASLRSWLYKIATNVCLDM